MLSSGPGGGGITPKPPSGPPRKPPQPYRPPPPPAMMAYSGGGGGGISGGGGGGGTGSNATGQVSSKTAVPSTSAFLGGDATYQSQQSQYQKALSDFMAQQGTQRTAYGNQYNLDVGALGKSRTQAQQGLTEDYASRGLMNSGLYGKAYSDLQGEYDTRQTQLVNARDTFLKQLNDALTNLKGEQKAGLTQAKQEAVGRRAAQYGVG